MSHGPPGDPTGIRTLARHWSGQAEAARTAASTLTSARNDINGDALGLRGGFAPTVHELIGDLPTELDKLGNGYAGCSTALETYATTLDNAQSLLRRAQTDKAAAESTKRSAEWELDAIDPNWDSWSNSLPWGKSQ